MIRSVTAVAAYLETLNVEQRRAVEHGVVDEKATVAAPLLIIAGADRERPIRSPTGSLT